MNVFLAQAKSYDSESRKWLPPLLPPDSNTKNNTSNHESGKLIKHTQAKPQAP